MKKIFVLLLALASVFTLVACGPGDKDVTVSSLSITTNPTKVQYNVGESLDLKGIQVKVTYSDQKEVTVGADDSKLVATGFDSANPKREQAITLKYDGSTASATFNVTIIKAGDTTARELIITPPAKTRYEVNASLDTTGLVVKVWKGDGTEEVLAEAGYTLSGFDSSKVGSGKVTVTVGALTATFDFTVVAIVVQGVTDTTILVGNTAAVSGAFAGVGIPFNHGLLAYFKQANKEGINGRTIQLKTYDDEFNAEKGLTYTKQLVEQDKIFALVGHFGTPTVGATIDYIQDIGVPMVYAATGINGLYFEKSVGNPVLAVQPIYLTDGRIMTARALNESLFGANGDEKLARDAKIGVLHTTSDDGASLKVGIETEIAWAKANDGFTGSAIYKSFSATDSAALDAAVNDFIAQGVKVVIVASNQAPFKTAVAALNQLGLHVPVFTSYVNADATSIDNAVDYKFPIFANAWVDMTKGATEENPFGDLGEFITAMNEYDPTLGGAAMTGVAYAIAGYIAGHVFVEGLKAVGANELTWESYIKGLESYDAIQIPMGGTVSFKDGRRWGIASMSLLKLGKVEGAHAWVADKPIEDLAVIQAK